MSKQGHAVCDAAKQDEIVPGRSASQAKPSTKSCLFRARLVPTEPQTSNRNSRPRSRERFFKSQLAGDSGLSLNAEHVSRAASKYDVERRPGTG